MKKKCFCIAEYEKEVREVKVGIYIKTKHFDVVFLFKIERQKRFSLPHSHNLIGCYDSFCRCLNISFFYCFLSSFFLIFFIFLCRKNANRLVFTWRKSVTGVLLGRFLCGKNKKTIPASIILEKPRLFFLAEYSRQFQTKYHSL